MTEQRLFDYLKQEYFKDLEMSEDPFSRWDCFSNQYKTRIELKCRKTHYSELMIEQDKYWALISYYIFKDYIPLYINSTPKGIYCFDLREITPEWQTDERMPQTTEFNKTDRVQKTYAMLSLFSAKKI